MGSAWCGVGRRSGVLYPAWDRHCIYLWRARCAPEGTLCPGGQSLPVKGTPYPGGQPLPMKGTLPRRRAAATKSQDAAWEHLPSGDRTTRIGSRILRGAVGCSIDAYDLFGDGIHERFVKRLTREPPSIKERAEQRGDHGG